jgi:hypothetical protein
MTFRIPPPLATWLLEHAARGYRSDSLAGDLFEEYQLSRTPGWYWRQVMSAIFFTQLRRLRPLSSQRGTSILTALLAQFAVLLGVGTLVQQYRQNCLARSTLVTDLMTFVSTAVPIGFAIVVLFLLTILSALRNPHVRLYSRLMKRSLAAFAVFGLGGGALAWASTAPCAAASCTCPSSFQTSSNPTYPVGVVR